MYYGYAYSVAIVIALIAILVLFIVRRRGAPLQGKVVYKDICRANFTTSTIEVELSPGVWVQLVFDTVATITCKHKFGEQCFHGKGEALDDSIQFGDILYVRTERVGSALRRDVRRLVSTKNKYGFPKKCDLK